MEDVDVDEAVELVGVEETEDSGELAALEGTLYVSGRVCLPVCLLPQSIRSGLGRAGEEHEVGRQRASDSGRLAGDTRSREAGTTGHSPPLNPELYPCRVLVQAVC